jgi:hypothetical protein
MSGLLIFFSMEGIFYLMMSNEVFLPYIDRNFSFMCSSFSFRLHLFFLFLLLGNLDATLVAIIV